MSLLDFGDGLKASQHLLLRANIGVDKNERGKHMLTSSYFLFLQLARDNQNGTIIS